jgi:hypothetical protein
MEQPGFTPNATDHFLCKTNRAFGGVAGYVEYTAPWAGNLTVGAISETGTLKIGLPVGYSAAATNYVIIDMTIQNKTGARVQAFSKKRISFSVYSSGVTGVSFNSQGDNFFQNSIFIPRVSYDGSKLCILMGSAGTGWGSNFSYNFWIDKIKVIGNETSGWDNSDGYSVTIISSESGYTTSSSDSSQYLAGYVGVGFLISNGYVQSATGYLFGSGRAVTSSISDSSASPFIGRFDTTNGPITHTLWGNAPSSTNQTYFFWKSSSDSNAVAFNSGAATCTFADGSTTLMTNALVNQYDYIRLERSYVTGLGASNGVTARWVIAARGNALTGEGFQYTPTPVWTYTPVPTATPYGVLTCTSVSAAGATFGMSPNFTNFESDGTMVMNGNSTVWDDIQFIATSGKVPASHYPAWTTWNGDFAAYTFAVDDYIDLGAKEVMHGYKEGTDLYPHLHWVVNGTDVNARAVKWELVYSTSPSSESSPYTYVFPAPQTLSAEVTLQAGVTDRTSIYQEMGTISGSGLKTGSLIRLRIRRVTAAGTAPTNNPFGFEVGVHAELDTIGSRTRTGK